MSAVNLMTDVDARTHFDIRLARAEETGLVLSLVEELLAELGDEGEEFAGIDRERLLAQLEAEHRRAARPEAERHPERPGAAARFLAFIARDEQGEPIGVLTLSTAFAIYAGGEYGIIEEMYVRPGYRGREVGRRMIEAALGLVHQRGWRRLEVTGPAAARPGATRPETAPLAALADQPDAALGGVSASPGRAVRFYERLGSPTAARS